MISDLWRDIRYGLRVLRKSPHFTVVAVLSLALGIGANTAIFQLLNAVRLRPLPVAKPNELVEIRIPDATAARGGWSSWHATSTNPLWEQIRDRQQAFSGVFAWGTDNYFNLATGGEARFARGLWVSGDFFNVLGIEPIMGRAFTSMDDRPGCDSSGVVISFAFWQREFGGEPSIVGKTLTLQDRPFQIIGVTPPSFYGLEIGKSFDVALPICSEGIFDPETARTNSGTEWWLTVMGRLKPGWSPAQATAHLASISSEIFEASLRPEYPSESVKDYLAFKLAAYPAGTGVSQLRDAYESSLWLLLAIAALVLLIACANLANLMLARANAREREIAVRLALGASRGRLIRQLVTESLLLAVAGVVLAALLARTLSNLLISFISTEGNTLFLTLDPDWRVVVFMAGLGILTCVLFGLIPAVRATRIGVGAVMRAGGRGLTASRARFSLRRVLVVSQVTLTMVLLVGALLFSRSLVNLLTVDAGIHQKDLAILYINAGDLNVPPGRRHAFKRELLDRIRSVAGVEAVAETSVVPLSGGAWQNKVWLDGSDSSASRHAYHSRISRDYFKTLKTPLLAGRDFDDGDSLTSPKVAIVNESFARSFLAGANPIGKRFRMEATPKEPELQFEIVGLVKDARYRNLREEISPVFFHLASQDERPGLFLQVLVRYSATAADITSMLKSAVSDISPAIVTTSGLMEIQIENSLLRERLMATLSGFFGALALLLACVGLYGLMAYSVAGRTKEIGIRVALGALSGNVLWLILREGLQLTIVGVAISLPVVFALSGLVKSLLFELPSTDSTSIGVATLLMVVVAGLAALVPARRALRVDPMVALRYE